MISHLSDQSDSTRTCGCVVILEMSTKNSLTTPEYCKGIRLQNKTGRNEFQNIKHAQTNTSDRSILLRESLI